MVCPSSFSGDGQKQTYSNSTDFPNEKVYYGAIATTLGVG
ncbi:hypothetical protein MC28_G051 (plasmid) [Bacillus thuringiensis MC28]|nr:hypothetical protein MC28_G051 [Bacillus thuringiensis MC28]